MERWICGLKLIHWQSSGHGTPVLFIPGAHGTTTYLTNWAKFTADSGRDAFALNLRGHGGSRPVKNLGRVSIHDYAIDICDAIDEIGPVFLICHSMAALAGLLAVSHDKRVFGLILVSGAPPKGISVLRPGTKSLRGLWKARREMYAMFLKKPLQPSPPFFLADNGTRIDLVPESGTALKEMAFGLIEVEEYGITCPIFVVGSSEDQTIPPEVQPLIAEKLGATYLHLAGYGHSPMIQTSWEFPIASILNWIHRNEAVGSA